MSRESNNLEYVHIKIDNKENIVLAVTASFLNGMDNRIGAYDALEAYVSINKSRFTKVGSVWDGTWLSVSDVYKLPLRLSQYSPFCFAGKPSDVLESLDFPLNTAQILNADQFRFWEQVLKKNEADGLAFGSKLLIGVETPGLKCLYQVEINV